MASKPDHPAVQAESIHLNTTIQVDLHDVAVAERVAQVSGNGLDDKHCLEVSAFEVAAGAPPQLHSDGRQDQTRVIRKVKAIVAAEDNAKALDARLEALNFYLNAKHGVSFDRLSANRTRCSCQSTTL